MSNDHKELYAFDKFRLDVSERILWREGERVPLSEKAFETLCSLVRRGNRLVGKDELLSEIWPDAIVEENNLDKNISILRQVLGERAGKGKFIETVRGHGFRFVPEVREISDEKRRNGDEENLERSGLTGGLLSGGNPSDSPVASDRINQSKISNSKSQIHNSQVGSQQDENSVIEVRKTSRFWLITLFIIVAAAAGLLGLNAWRGYEKPTAKPIKTVAVLPFKSIVAENRDEALEMGVADTLISKLSGGEEISVLPLSSVRRYAALEQDSLTAGRELNVEAVLDGSIQTAGERIRISVRLVRISDGKQMWTGQFDEKFTDIFAVQDSISEQVATALKIRLGSLEKKRQTENVEAYQLYMKGRFHLLKGVGAELETAITYYQQAIEADPNYALAYAGLADAYRGCVVGGELPSAEFMPKAKAAANKAIELDETLAEAHANLGHVMFWYDWDWNAAENQYKRALELDPKSSDALQFYAHLLTATGRHDEALAKIKLARELDPVNLRVNAIEGMLLVYAGQTDEAITRLQKTLELDPNYSLAHMMAARAYAEKGRLDEAVAATRKTREISPFKSEPIAFGGYALAKSSNLAEARTALDELLGLSKTRYVPPYFIALVYNGIGESGKTLDYLEKAFAEKDVRMVFLKVEPKWNNLRQEPRFMEIIRRMNLR